MKYIIKIFKYMGLFSLSFVLGIFILSSNILRSIPEQVEEQTRIHATIYDYVSEEERMSLQKEIENLNKVKNVTFSSKEQELKYLLEYYKDDGTLEKLYAENNPLQDTFIIEINNLDYVEDVINSIDQFADIDQISSNHKEVGEVVNRSGVVINVLNVISILIAIVVGIRLRHLKAFVNIDKQNIKKILISTGISLLTTISAIVVLFITYDSVFIEVGKMLTDTGLSLLTKNEQLILLTSLLLLFSIVWSITGKCKEILKEDFE